MQEQNEEDVTSSRKSVNLKQKISLLNGICLIVGQIIGSGIFLTPKGVQLKCGSPALSLIIWVVCGAFSMVGAICYAELGTTIVKSGANYAYILEAFGPMIAFVRLLISLFVIVPTTGAITAITFANYLIQPFFPTCDPPFYAVRLLAAACVCILTFMNCVSVRYGTRIQDTFAYSKVLALVVIIITGLIALGNGTASSSFTEPWKDTTTNIGNIALAMYSGLYAYTGWDTLNFVIEELQEPYKNLPRAICISLPICTVIYVLVNVAYYAVLSPEEMASSDAVAVVFAQKTLGVMSWIVPMFVAMSTIGSLNACLISSSRLFFVGAREGHLPDYVGMISIRNFTPAPSLILAAIPTIIYLCVENLFDLVNYYSFMYWLVVGLAIAGQILLRIRRPEMPRPLKFSLAYPITFCSACLFLIVVPYFTETRDSLIGTAVLLVGFPLYFTFVHIKPDRQPKVFRSVVNSVTAFFQKLLPVAITEKEINREF